MSASARWPMNPRTVTELGLRVSRTREGPLNPVSIRSKETSRAPALGRDVFTERRG